MIETDKTKDSDLLAVMIYRSFVAPETLPTPPDATFISFRDALDLYARTVMREQEDAVARWKSLTEDLTPITAL